MIKVCLHITKLLSNYALLSILQKACNSFLFNAKFFLPNQYKKKGIHKNFLFNIEKMCYNSVTSWVRLVGEKDLTEKQLFELDADIVNVLLLDGKPLILPEELTPAKKDSLYKDKELRTRMQERDVAKLWTQKNIRLAFFGLEDQTAIDYDMALRIIGYDGAVY